MGFILDLCLEIKGKLIQITKHAIILPQILTHFTGM